MKSVYDEIEETEANQTASATVTGISFTKNRSIGTGDSLFCCFLLGWQPLAGCPTDVHRVSL